jgi:hypothetical protein
MVVIWFLGSWVGIVEDQGSQTEQLRVEAFVVSEIRYFLYWCHREIATRR